MTTVLEVKQSEALTLQQEAAALSVETNADYENAAEFLKRCKALEAEIRGVIDPMVDAAHKAHKAATTQRNKLLDPIQEAAKIIGRTMGTYMAKLEQARREEERRLREQRQREEEAKALELAAQLEAQASAAREAGKQVEAEMKTQQAETVINTVPDVVVRVKSEAPKVSNTMTRETWRFEVTDAAAVPREFLTVNEQAIGAMVRTMKDKTNIPGVRVWSETSVTARN